jgi:hypothetical protein
MVRGESEKEGEGFSTKIEILIFIHCSIYERKNDVVVELKFDRCENFPRNDMFKFTHICLTNKCALYYYYFFIFLISILLFFYFLIFFSDFKIHKLLGKLIKCSRTDDFSNSLLKIQKEIAFIFYKIKKITLTRVNLNQPIWPVLLKNRLFFSV